MIDVVQVRVRLAGPPRIRVSQLGVQGARGEPGPQGDPGVGLENLDVMLFLADEGPFENHPTAYREMTGTPVPTSIVWWTTSGKTHRIIDKTIVYNANLTPATVTRRVYGSDGVTVSLAAVDTIVYSGVFETHRTRVVT